MQVSFGRIYKANVYYQGKKVNDEQLEKKALTLVARNLSSYKDPDEYSDLVKQQRILTRMHDPDYQIPTAKKTPNSNNTSTVSTLTVPDIGKYIVIGKYDNDSITDIRHKEIGIPYYQEGQSMQSAYIGNFRNSILSYFKAGQRLSDHELNIQISNDEKGEIFISLLNFKKLNPSKT